MKRQVVFLLLLFFQKLHAQTNLWTWVNGETTLNTNPSWGTKGVAAASNTPGAREYAGSFTDASGNFWLFGGHTQIGVFNDLWKYDRITNLWTWVSGDNASNSFGNYGLQGVASNANKPGAREYMKCWSDGQGNLWVFGGRGNSSSTNGYLNDLWRYEISSGLWTWMSGDNNVWVAGNYGTKGVASPTNKPGSRIQSYCWSDGTGQLWLFGGSGVSMTSTGELNDLWKYDILTGVWTWVSGDNIRNTDGIYGAKGTPASSNKPGARYGGVGWAKPGELWLYGGYTHFVDLNIGSTEAHLGDLWRYDIAANQWTWVKGENSLGAPRVYGTKGVAASTNEPGFRTNPIAWNDSQNNFWLFGGYQLNDLWKFDPSTGWWAWMSGDNTTGNAGVYGTKGVATASNKPGARGTSIAWTDFTGNLWLYGGFGFAASTSTSSRLSDLWKYTLSNNTLPVTIVNFSIKWLGRNSTEATWQTATEQNTKEFIVERSAAASLFAPIGAKPAAGNSTTGRAYSFEDDLSAYPQETSFHYRLRMVDNDGSFTYSKIIVLDRRRQAQSLFTMSPNPVTGSLQLFFVKPGQLTIHDATGRHKLQQAIQNTSTKTVDVSGYGKGMYFATFRTADGTQQTQAFVKE